MGALLGVIGILSFIVGVVALIVFWITKKPKKIPLVLLVGGFALLMVGFAIDPPAETEKGSNVSPASSNKAPQDAKKAEKEGNTKQRETKKEEKPAVSNDDSLKESDIDQGSLSDLKESFNELIANSEGSIISIKPYDDDWNHVRVTVNNGMKQDTKPEKQALADSIGPEVKNRINGYIGDGDPDFEPFITFSYEDGSTMAESGVLDQSVYKVK